MKRLPALLLAVALLAVAGCATHPTVESAIDERLPVFGHRNLILVADSAYPAQCSPGVETVYVGGSHAGAVRRALAIAGAAKHVRPKIYFDAELAHVSGKYAPGVDSLRKELAAATAGFPVATLPHDDLIRKLDTASKTFRVLVLKTDGVTAYSSVLIELECGYWSDAAETALRRDMAR